MLAGSTPWVLPTTQTDLDTDESKCRVVHSQKQELHGAVSARTGWAGTSPLPFFVVLGNMQKSETPSMGQNAPSPGAGKQWPQ